MATDLFNQYFGNATKSYIYSNLACNQAGSADTYFTISDGNGIITDGNNTFSSIALDDIMVPCVDYTNETRTLDPYEVMYVRGISQGLAYEHKAYGVIPEEFTVSETWEENVGICFRIKYVNEQGFKKVCLICGRGEYGKSFTEVVQEIFDKAKIMVNITTDEHYVYFDGSQEGYEFWIVAVKMKLFEENLLGNCIENTELLGAPKIVPQVKDEWTGYNPPSLDGTEWINGFREVACVIDRDRFFPMNTPDTIYLFEDPRQYIPAFRYPNGGMRGVILKAIYPEFNAESIPETQLSIKVAHLRNRIEDVYYGKMSRHHVPICVNITRDVCDLYQTQYEFDLFNTWRRRFGQLNYFDEWIEFDEKLPEKKEGDEHWTDGEYSRAHMLHKVYCDESRYDAVGVYGYATWCTKHDAWMNVGSIYIRTTTPDDPTSVTKNLIPSFIVYNPNNFPVIVKYMMFA